MGWGGHCWGIPHSLGGREGAGEGAGAAPGVSGAPVSPPPQSCTPRWQTCISNTDDTLGFALGSLFVKATFDRDSKAIVRTIPPPSPPHHPKFPPPRAR